AAQWPPALPLLRTMRARLRGIVELFVEPNPDFPCIENRPPEADRERDGAGVDHGQVWQGHGRFLHRQTDARGKTGPLPHGRPGRERVRIGAPAAQFENAVASKRSCKLVWRGGALSHRYARI